MAVKSTKLRKSLKEAADDNASVTRGTSKEQQVLKKGIPNDHSVKHFNTSTVGVSIGSTINMDNYESLRVDVWLTDSIKEDETTEQAYQRVVKVVDETLENLINQYTE